MILIKQLTNGVVNYRIARKTKSRAPLFLAGAIPLCQLAPSQRKNGSKLVPLQILVWERNLRRPVNLTLTLVRIGPLLFLH